jgi:hypothetical protein
MNLRIEFIEAKSPSFKRVLGICRKIKGFKHRKEDGMTIYSLEFKEEDVYTAEAVNDFVHAWKGTAYYADGKLISRGRAWSLIGDAAREAFYRFRGARPAEGTPTPGNEGLRKSRLIAENIIPGEIVPPL